MIIKPIRTLGVFFTAIIFSSVLVSAQNVAQTGQGSVRSAEASAPTKIEKIESDVSEALTLIQEQHFVGKEINYNDVFKSSITGMLRALDPHSSYFDSKEFQEFKTQQSSRYFGIGATIGDLTDGSGKLVGTYIRATFDGAPAHRAGLRYGDMIVEVNGTDVVGKPFPEVRDLLRGPRDTKATLKYKRHGSDEIRIAEITRDAVPQPSIQEAYLIRPGVGYIAMTGGFNSTTYQEFDEAMTRLKSQGMQSLVLDLKNNGGGLVSQAYGVANTFLRAGQNVFTQKGRIEGATRPINAMNPMPESIPVVVLVNQYSASASEILAGALQDHDRALIVGQNTFGKGLVQSPMELDYDSMLLLTVAKYETPSGRLIQRDYSDGSLYDYYENENSTDKPLGEKKFTNAGRPVYSGRGIQPDVEIKPDMITIGRAREQARMNNAIFHFAMDIAYGKIKGFESYKIDRPIRFNQDIKAADFPMTDQLYRRFKDFAVKEYKYTSKQIDDEKEFVERALRTEFVTAAYGMTTSMQVMNLYDTQLKKAIDLMPQAKELAESKSKKDSASTNQARPTNP